MSDKELNNKEKRLAEMLIREYITETQYLEMLSRIRTEQKEESK